MLGFYHCSYFNRLKVEVPSYECSCFSLLGTVFQFHVVLSCFTSSWLKMNCGPPTLSREKMPLPNMGKHISTLRLLLGPTKCALDRPSFSWWAVGEVSIKALTVVFKWNLDQTCYSVVICCPHIVVVWSGPCPREVSWKETHWTRLTGKVFSLEWNLLGWLVTA